MIDYHLIHFMHNILDKKEPPQKKTHGFAPGKYWHQNTIDVCMQYINNIILLQYYTAIGL